MHFFFTFEFVQKMQDFLGYQQSTKEQLNDWSEFSRMYTNVISKIYIHKCTGNKIELL